MGEEASVYMTVATVALFISLGSVIILFIWLIFLLLCLCHRSWSNLAEINHIENQVFEMENCDRVEQRQIVLCENSSKV